MRKAQRFKLIIISIVLGVNLNYSFSQENNTELRDQAIAQMNYNIAAMTSVINNNSIEVLDYEMDQLLNNLRISEITELREIQSFRSALLDLYSKCQMTAEERAILQQIQEKRRESLIWQSMSQALNPTMILTNVKGGKQAATQAAFYSILSAARTTVEYKSQTYELDIEELQAMWELHEQDMNEWLKARKKAMDTVFNLYKRFGLKEEDRLTEETANLYNDIITDNNAERRIRRLKDHYTTFKGQQSYYYYLGMAYMDNSNYNAAKPQFDKYISLTSKTPIFRKDPKLGCVYLAKMTYEDITNKSVLLAYTQNVLTNLPNNGAAWVQCAMTCYAKGLKKEAFEILRRGIDNPNITDKNFIIMLASIWCKEIKKEVSIYNDISAAIKSSTDFSFGAYLSYLISSSDKHVWDECEKLIQIEDPLDHAYFGLGSSRISTSFKINLQTYKLNLKDLNVYCESAIKDSSLYIYQMSKEYANGIVSKSELKEKVSCFERDSSLIYNFFTSVDGAQTFRVKQNIDFNKKSVDDYSGMGEVTHSDEKAIEKLVKKYATKSGAYSIKCKELSGVGELLLPLKSYSIKANIMGVNHQYLRYSLYETVGDAKNSKQGNYSVHCIGDTLSYNPIIIYQETKPNIKLVFTGLSPVVLTYIIDPINKEELVLGAIENQDTILFNPSYTFSAFIQQPEESYASLPSDSTKSFIQKMKFWKKDEAENETDIEKNSEVTKDEDISSPSDSTKSFIQKMMFWKKDDAENETDIEKNSEVTKDEDIYSPSDSTKSFIQKMKFWEKDEAENETDIEQNSEVTKDEDISSPADSTRSFIQKLKFWKKEEAENETNIEKNSESTKDEEISSPADSSKSFIQKMKFWKK